jgi:hypothetical protein
VMTFAEYLVYVQIWDRQVFICFSSHTIPQGQCREENGGGQ